MAVVLDQKLDEIKYILDTTGIRRIQLHGHEGPELINELRKTYGEYLEIWKVVHVEKNQVQNVEPFLGLADVILLDTKVGGKSGGTGQTFDWSIIPIIQGMLKPYHIPLIIAGGITPDNIASLREYEIDGVDLASGVETDLKKDRSKIVNMILGVKRDADR